MTSTLAEALPRPRFCERHSLDVDAPLERVWQVLTEVRWSDLRITTPLFLIRSLGRSRELADQRILDRGPVTLMRTDAPRYAVAAQIGRPWQLSPEPGPGPMSLLEVLAFDEPGWLKYGMDFTLQDLGSGRTRITTTTLCEPTDESARRRFLPYWVLIRPFSGLIRRDVLHASARRASRTDASTVAPDQRVLLGPAPRFGLPRYLRADFTVPEDPVLQITGRVDRAFARGRDELDALPETTKDLDLHCVMTWSVEGTRVHRARRRCREHRAG